MLGMVDTGQTCTTLCGTTSSVPTPLTIVYVSCMGGTHVVTETTTQNRKWRFKRCWGSEGADLAGEGVEHEVLHSQNRLLDHAVLGRAHQRVEDDRDS